MAWIAPPNFTDGELVTETKLDILSNDLNDLNVRVALGATTYVTRVANSPNVTGTETIVDTLVVPVVSGQSYRIVWDGATASSNASGHSQIRIRAGSTTAGVQLRDVNIVTTHGSGFQHPAHLEAVWTSAITGNQSFVATLARPTGTGNQICAAGSTNMTVFYAVNIY